MANSITGINDDIISQNILQSFVAELSPLIAFTTNFNAEAARPGATISVMRVAGGYTAAAKTTHAAYTLGEDLSSDAVEITLGQPTYVEWSLDDVEIASSSVLNMEVYGQQKGSALAVAVFQNICGAITAATYGAAVHTGIASGFDLDDIVDIMVAADTANMPKTMRSLVLGSAYFGNLLKQPGVQSASDFGDATALKQGVIARLLGMDIYASTIIPTNGENLTGFLAYPSGLCVAMRYLQPQEGNTYFRAEPITDPSGITLGLPDWYNNATGVRTRIMECVSGKVAGIAAGVKRIISA